MEVSYLHRCFHVDFEIGRLTWKRRDDVPKNWNTRFAGQVAGGIKPIGYEYVSVMSKRYLVHRIVWAMFHGRWPSHEIDHINGIRSDNRIVNLRAVTRAENARNCSRRVDNKTGFSGIDWDKKLNKWRVRVAGCHIGVYFSFDDAVSVRNQAMSQNEFTSRHGVLSK